MSAAWYIVLEREVPGFDHFVNGKALAKAGDLLDSIAKDKGGRSLMDFFGAAPEEIAGFAKDHGLTLKKSFQQEWFFAEDGLKTVEAILEEAEKRQLDMGATGDLRAFQKVLETAQKNGIRWHLAMDF